MLDKMDPLAKRLCTCTLLSILNFTTKHAITCLLPKRQNYCGKPLRIFKTRLALKLPEVKYSQLSLRRTMSGLAPTVRLREVSVL